MDQNLILTFDQLFGTFAEVYWNRVLACPTCNLQKNDKLAAIIYLDKLLDRNKKIILVNEKAKDMGNYSEQNLRAAYYWAKLNGYDNIWQPKKMIEG